ncbi:DUF3047 domain-containing protein [Marinobacter halodurans]|uniref:DUF3047 domain-containing protein n=1 Tax=Marinobacter halodurans TaxID=2528979 RepID=A0ABY1ZPH7_9GAMM|nr:DUF3047 domain-containing protein [Marinobacter halodurans]TBW58757.1 DUF3047 domain-containing protein [Marinobacter halodurans]
MSYHLPLLTSALLGLSLLAFPAVGGGERVDIGRFSAGDLTGWETGVYDGRTRYELRPVDDRMVLYADSRGTASGLYYQTHVNLDRTPYLNWSWKVDNILDNPDERERSGDDYPARLFVVFSDGLSFWNAQVIDYVWSSSQASGSEWPNAYAANVRMIAVHAGSADVGRWVSEKRNVLADYRHLFGARPGAVDVVALMTDTDNTQLSAQAWYGDIWFSED